jgi:hypothetical protein
MTAGALLWLLIFGVCGGLFFGIAVVVTLRGIGDLRELLKSAEHK